jgi:CheY-like chemotaxis protein
VHGRNTVLAGSGHQTPHKLTSAPARLILSDFRMLEMSIAELRRRLRCRPAFPDFSIVL